MIEDTVRTYVAAWMEPDPRKRAPLLEACFAVDGRICTRGTTIQGRAGLDTAIANLHERLPGLTIRMTSRLDVQGRMFRMRGEAIRGDGSVFGVNHDAGEVDADGRIALILTFDGDL